MGCDDHQIYPEMWTSADTEAAAPTRSHQPSSGSTTSTADFTGIGGWFTNHILDAEAKKELDQLTAERKLNTTALRQTAFRALPKERRQFIIDFRKATDDSQNIGSIQAPRTDRENELRNKHFVVDMYDECGFDIYPNRRHALDTGLSIEEMEAAHVGACLEEILLAKETHNTDHALDYGVGGC